MIIPHFAGAPNQTIDEFFTSAAFHDVSIKLAYTFPTKTDSNIELYTGVKNVFNSYQSNFDIGRNRDSNFVFGPAQPRAFFLGLKWYL